MTREERVSRRPDLSREAGAVPKAPGDGDGDEFGHEATIRRILAAAEYRDHDLWVALMKGVGAQQRGESEVALALLRQVATSGHAEAEPLARFLLADILALRGDVPGALEQLRTVSRSGHSDLGPLAACDLADQLEDDGDLPGATAAWKQAIDSGHPFHSGRAACWLAKNLLDEGNAAEALPLLRLAMDSRAVPWAGWAAVHLGDLLGDLGDNGVVRDVRGAWDALQVVLTLGDPRFTPVAVVGLGFLVDEGEGIGDPADAYAALRLPAASPSAEARAGEAADAQQAYIQGNLMRWRGRWPAARGAYLRAAASGHPVYATAARHMLDRILFSR
jgi:tetratricopeptide (TPR) repeat protein